ncbi:hypothetical protein B0J13DRAFT_547221 [Dactylonectria estremocensis]|uniref:Uncharacterized protein n=1 Tax=Dactylonectria estremocensis TaxID=1079267 RepID=A0A9P9F3F5_9HYPO|nr:hypothetical protein B0J13DRAFT_547221 [Dactylonectria estremocensis]
MRAKGRICIRCSDLRIECTFKQLRRRNGRKLRWSDGTDNRAKPECATNAPAITKLSSENPSYLYFKRFDYFWLPRYGRGISSSSSGDMAYLTPDGAVHSTCDLQLLPWLQEKGIKKLFNVEEEGQQICNTSEAILKLRFFTWQSFAQVIHLEASQYRAIAEFAHTAEIVRVELRRSKDQIRLENAKESVFKFSLPHKKIYSIQFELEDPVGYTVVFIDQDERHVISRPIEKQKSLFQNQLLEDRSDKLRSFILMGQPLLWSNIRHDMSPVRLNEVNKQWKPMIDRLREQGHRKFSTLHRR